MKKSDDYYGIPIATTQVGDRWKWQVTLPVGATITSNKVYDSASKALTEGREWINIETALQALNACLSELYKEGVIHRSEYCNLMDSSIKTTRRR
ncbi:MAG TPA: hypothetical protein IGS53_24765 [Leptolyngbyaceae cyanobacterium M33_DOE_097]|uniref:Uncharacterized protein n=1 Tax=Oscillatoriales cyanobacterium SpSt-418 TaxID=2282169 RepID=A0A7C3PHN9_9CYAN|nr:hypothetical protein [Leptolyngbyaceae cyanobacterium M33_DOE_097]